MQWYCPLLITHGCAYRARAARPAPDRTAPRVGVSCSAQASQHLLKHVIAADADFVADDLHVGVAVAEMPGEPHGIEWAASCNFDQRFLFARHQHDRPVVEHEAVAVAQHQRLGKIEQEFGALFAPEHDAAALPVAGIEHDAVARRGCVPLAGRLDAGYALHGHLKTSQFVDLFRA